MKKRRNRIILISLLLTGLFFGCAKEEAAVTGQLDEEPDSSNSLEEIQEEAPDAGQEEAAVTAGTGSIYIYVCGAVVNPGVYELHGGSRVYEAIEAAGGIAEDGSDSYLNQASVLEDGQKVYVPTEKEAEKLESQEAVPGDNAEGAAGESSGLININTAGKEQLMTLPGIGEVKAESIIAYRQEQGEFKKIEDIKSISGIGESTFSKLESLIVVQ